MNQTNQMNQLTVIQPSQQRPLGCPDRGGKDLKLGTIGGVLRQLGIDFEDFEKK